MAELDTILMCKRCVHPLEGLICPDCKDMAVQVPSLLLQSLRILKLKGWIVEKWETFNKADNPDAICFSNPYDWQFALRLEFFLFAPSHSHPTLFPDPKDQIAANVLPDFNGMKPAVIGGGKTEVVLYRLLYHWARDVEPFALPFGQGLCDKCFPQGADWFFCRVKCPRVKEAKLINFASLPTNCVYLVEQTVTASDRYVQMDRMGFFNRNPIARRRCAQWKKTNT